MTPFSALQIPIGNKEQELAKNIEQEILEKAKKYIEFTKINTTPSHYLSAAKDLEDYILLYFSEPDIIDGGFEIVYSKKLQKIVGFFSAGYKG